MDDTFDRLVNIQTYNDAALKDLLERLNDEERQISKKRRILHGEIDIIRAELVRRARDRHAAGGDAVGGSDLDDLTSILGGRGPRGGQEASAGAKRIGTGGAHAAQTPSEQPAPGDSVRDRFHDLSVSVRDERIIRYIDKQLGQGRRLEDIMSDAYMLSHTSEEKRAELMQNPQVIQILERQIKRQFAEYDSDIQADLEKGPGD